MYKIVGKQLLNPQIKKIDVVAKELCQKLSVGQFITVTPIEKSFPIAIATVDVDPIKGTLGIVFNEANDALMALGELKIGDTIHSVDGPYAQVFKCEKYGNVLTISDGDYIVNNLALCRAFKKAGNRIFGVGAFDDRKNVILESQLRSNCDNVNIIVDRANKLEGIKKVLSTKNFDCIAIVGPIDFIGKVLNEATQYDCPIKIGLSEILKYGFKKNLESFVQINNVRTFLMFEPLIFDHKEIKFDQIIQQMQELEEYENCQKLISKQLSQAKGLKILPRLFTDLIKKPQ